MQNAVISSGLVALVPGTAGTSSFPVGSQPNVQQDKGASQAVPGTEPFSLDAGLPLLEELDDAPAEGEVSGPPPGPTAQVAHGSDDAAQPSSPETAPSLAPPQIIPDALFILLRKPETPPLHLTGAQASSAADTPSSTPAAGTDVEPQHPEAQAEVAGDKISGTAPGPVSVFLSAQASAAVGAEGAPPSTLAIPAATSLAGSIVGSGTEFTEAKVAPLGAAGADPPEEPRHSPTPGSPRPPFPAEGAALLVPVTPARAGGERWSGTRPAMNEDAAALPLGTGNELMATRKLSLVSHASTGQAAKAAADVVLPGSAAPDAGKPSDATIVARASPLGTPAVLPEALDSAALPVSPDPATGKSGPSSTDSAGLLPDPDIARASAGGWVTVSASTAPVPAPPPAGAEDLRAAALPVPALQAVAAPSLSLVRPMAGAEARLRLLAEDDAFLAAQAAASAKAVVVQSAETAVVRTVAQPSSERVALAIDPPEAVAAAAGTAPSGAPGRPAESPAQPPAPPGPVPIVSPVVMPTVIAAPARPALPLPAPSGSEPTRGQEHPPREELLRHEVVAGLDRSRPPGPGSVVPGSWPVPVPEAIAASLQVDPLSALPDALPEVAGFAGPVARAEVPVTPVAGPAQSPQQTPQAQIATAVLQAAGGVTELRLSPEELGSVRIELRTDGDQVVLTISAERQDTQDLLRRHADKLVEEMRQAGFAETSIGFGSWAGSDGREARHAPTPPADPQAAEAAEAPPAISAPVPRAPAPQGAWLYLRF